MSSLADFPPGVVAELAISTFPGNLNLASAAALIYWDVFINLEQEIEFIWQKPLSLVSVLYALMRYLPLMSQTVDMAIAVGVFNTTRNICGGLLWFTALLTPIIIIIVDIFFIFRIYAFYTRSKLVLYSLAAIYSVVSIINFVFAVLTGTEYQSQRTTILAELFPGIIDECVTSTIPKFESAVLLTEVIFQTLLFALVLGRFVFLQIEAWKAGRGTNQLYVVFLRDGLWSYFFFFGMLCNSKGGILEHLQPTPVFFLATAVLVKDQEPQALPIEYYIVSSLGIIPPRILLNLKQLGTINPSEASQFIHTSTGISFATPRKERPPQEATPQSTYPMQILPRERDLRSTFIEEEEV